MATHSSADVLDALRESIRRIEGAQQRDDRRPLSSGCPPLDRLLPTAGFWPGILIEWLAEAEGSGAETLAMLAAREAITRGGTFVVLDREGRFYPPAAAALGIDLERTIVVRARRLQDELWALDQALRSRSVAVACVSLERLDWRWFRRLQLAVEQGGGLGFLLRPANVRGQPTWSQVQLLVQPQPSPGPRRLRIEITRCQGAALGRAVELEIHEVTGEVRARKPQEANVASLSLSSLPACGVRGRHETLPVHLAAQLAHPTPRRRSARA